MLSSISPCPVRRRDLRVKPLTFSKVEKNA
jgi:hypothetical protein